MSLLLGFVVVIICLVVYLRLPGSRLKRDFLTMFDQSKEEIGVQNGILSEDDTKKLPQCIQKFYKISHMTGSPKRNALCIYTKGADFFNMEANRKLKINYYEHFFGPKPCILTFIDSSLFGIPFQGIDSFVDGKGGMKGVVAKNFTIFNVRGMEMDVASLATWLALSIFLPICLIENDIKWEELSNTRARATFRQGELSTSCEYIFDENGKLMEAYVEDRGLAKNDGTMIKTPWSVYFGDYKEYGELYLPSFCKATWHLDEGDVVYYDGINSQYDFEVKKPFGK